MEDFFKTNIISNKHDRFIYPFRWLVFCVIFFSIPVLLFSLTFALDTSFENPFSITISILTFIGALLVFNALLKIISQKFFRKGLLYISKDLIKLVKNDSLVRYSISELKEVALTRKSNFHREQWDFNIKREHGNRLEVVFKDLHSEQYEFQIDSRKHSKEFDRLISVLKKTHGNKIVYKSV